MVVAKGHKHKAGQPRITPRPSRCLEADSANGCMLIYRYSAEPLTKASQQCLRSPSRDEEGLCIPATRAGVNPYLYSTICNLYKLSASLKHGFPAQFGAMQMDLSNSLGRAKPGVFID